ncbi:IS701 family transposase (plasmid) [Sinorhizobium meliloti]|nr:IS701 family transposase [Sinorhizobium meliloti]
MAARVEPGRVQAAHQSLHHFVAKADWSDDAVLGIVRAQVLPALERQGPIRAWIVDDTGFPKKGKHSVGVARQYCGQLGKQDNCQVAVSLSVATGQASLPVAYQLYLPESWANDAGRREKAGVPEDVIFRTKPEIALTQIRAALDAGVSPGVVLADAGYGNDTAFRTRADGDGLDLCRRCPVLDPLVVAGHATAAAQAMERTRSPALARPAPARARAGFRQGTGASPARGRLAPHHLARGLQGSARLALCRRPRPAGPSRLLALRTTT